MPNRLRPSDGGTGAVDSRNSRNEPRMLLKTKGRAGNSRRPTLLTPEKASKADQT